MVAAIISLPLNRPYLQVTPTSGATGKSNPELVVDNQPCYLYTIAPSILRTGREIRTLTLEFWRLCDSTYAVPHI